MISATSLTVTFPNGKVWKHSPGRFEIRIVASEASGEGVEGEPVATLGGERGSPLGANWCRFCGDPAFDQFTCTSCWASSFEKSISVTGVAAEEAMENLSHALGQAFSQTIVPDPQPVIVIEPTLDSVQSLGLATQETVQSLGQFSSDLKQQAD